MRRAPGVKKRHNGWGQSTQDIVHKMASGEFKREQDEKKKRAKTVRLFHNIRRIDRHFGKEGDIFYDKLKFKRYMDQNGVLTPKTYAIASRERDLPRFWDQVKDLDTFVLKPDRMSEGRGIRVLEKTDDPKIWLEMDGSKIALETIIKELRGNINRQTNNRRIRGDRNSVFAEERIFVHDTFNHLIVHNGIVDFRVYVVIDKDFKEKEVLYAKVRCPSLKSRGMGNTAKGAIALFVDANGMVSDTDIFSNTTTKYNNNDYSGMKIPFWDQVKAKAEEVGRLFKSPFHSVDMTVNREGEVVVVEAEKIPLLRWHNPVESDRLANHLIKYAEEVLFK